MLQGLHLMRSHLFATAVNSVLQSIVQCVEGCMASTSSRRSLILMLTTHTACIIDVACNRAVVTAMLIMAQHYVLASTVSRTCCQSSLGKRLDTAVTVHLSYMQPVGFIDAVMHSRFNSPGNAGKATRETTDSLSIRRNQTG